jgi:NAD(P)-dependent dehydrogenase (short-subunit alcohol dehydrogenase family)
VEIGGKVALVTGGAAGIGRALAERLASEGARGVAVVDLDAEAAREVATSLAGGVGMAIGADVGDETAVRAAVGAVEEHFGPVDLCCANAGIIGGGGTEAPDVLWDRLWRVHVLSHVYLVRALLPRMLARRSGYFIHIASAAGLLVALGDAPYTVTKAATVALAEWLAITHRDDGIRFSCLCPQGVRTDMLAGAADLLTGRAVMAAGEVAEPADVAAAVADAVREERFLVLSHPEVADYLRRKAEDPDRWLQGMSRFQARLVADR